VVLDLDRVDAITEDVDAYIIAVDEYVQALVVFLLPGEGRSDMRRSPAHHAAAKGTGYGL
jgi:hypothetical protein